MSQQLFVRTSPKVRIWTGSTPAVGNVTPLDTQQARRLRQCITNLSKRDARFTAHKAALDAGKTVKANPNGQVAATIQRILAS